MSLAVRFSRTGGTEVLDVADVDEPHPGEGKVRVRVHSAGLNPFDSKVRRGDFALPLPRGQGAEFAGVIDEIGPDVEGWIVGDEVLGWIGSGAQAEYVVVAATSVAVKPAGLDWALAGALGLVSNTAWNATAAVAPTEHDTVLVTGAAGGVGLLAAQFALRSGASVVGTASREHHALLESLGIVPVSYGQGEVDRLRAAAPDGFTAAIDTVGVRGVDLALNLGVEPGRIDSIASGPEAATRGIQTIGGGGKSAAQLATFAEDAAAGRLVLQVRATFPLAEVRAAYDLLDVGHGSGKVVLLV